MTNYPSDRGHIPEGAQNPPGGDYQESTGAYQADPAGPHTYQGGGAYGSPQDTSQFPGPPQQWGGHPQGQPYPDQGHHGHQSHQGGLQGMLPGGSGSRGKNIRSTFKTTEFWIFVVLALAMLIAAAVTDQGPDDQGFGAAQAWKYVTWLGIAYILSRGLTKFGGHEKDDHDSSRHDHR